MPETVYTLFRSRDWDYLGFKYSVLSSIATGSWNNVMDMIPGRDSAEFEHFSAVDKSWIRNWLRWTVDHKDVLMHTRTILGQPTMGRADGTAAIVGNRGYVFLFNPNYKTLKAEVKWDGSTGLAEGAEFLLREVYPREGRLVGKPGSGVWRYGDVLSQPLEGTSVVVLELVPPSKFGEGDLVFGVTSDDPSKPLQATRKNGVLKIEHAAGPKGESGEASILMEDDKPLKEVHINGESLPFVQHGRYISVPLRFAGGILSHSQQVELHKEPDGSLVGTFTVPSRIRSQLEKRRELWPIPWTKEDHDTTWLVPDRLLLFIQMAEPSDRTQVRAEMDGSVLALTPAYSSVRKHSGSFVGWYADLSAIENDKPHSIRLTIPTLEQSHLQGIFFDNVEDEYTEELAP
jgi:hypothetical protein